MTNSAQVGQPALPVREETTAVRRDSGLTTTINAALRLPGDAGEGSLTAPLHAQLQEELAATGVQLSRSTHAVHALLARVSAHYHQIDEERRGIVRSMQIMAHEAESLTHDLAEQNSGHLRLILDHIKDAVITVDANGLIETFNPTGERIFGYTEAEVLGRRLDLLVLGIAEQGSVEVGLRRLVLSHEGARAGTIACEAIGRRKGGTEFPAEIAVSAARQGRRDFFVVCLRDASDRHTSELAMRESEARYRTLVDHAPEVICVYDVDAGKFADVNENAVRFFKMTREELLKVGPNVLSPPIQPDGKSSVDAPRGYIANALAGTPQTFEWVHRDAYGNDIACEVRLTRMPSATRRLLRGSITDISDRKRADLIASGEREVFAKLAANDSLPSVLEAIARLIESVCPGHRGTVSVLAADGKAFAYVVAPLLPAAVRQILERASIDIRDGSCAAAVYLGRQVIVADIDKDPFWELRRGPVTAAGLHASWSLPIKGASGRILGALGVYRGATGLPSDRELEWSIRAAQLAGIAIERRLAEEALRASESKYRGLFETVMEGVFQSTREGKFISVNPALVQMLAFSSAAEIYALPDASVLYRDAGDRAAFMHRIEAQGEVRNAEVCLRRQDGQLIWVLENARAMRDATGVITGYEGTIADITERKRAEQAVFAEKERALVTLQSIGDAVISTDAAGAIDYMNPVAERLTGWRADEARGLAITEVLAFVDDATRQPVEHPVSRCLASGEPTSPSDHTALASRSGGEVAITDTASPIRDRQGKVIGAVIVFHDVTRERRLKRALSYQASHDALTGLINRREFDSRLQAAVVAARRGDARYVCMYVDLDQFKVVNDTCGHPAGDRLIREITSILRARVRASDTIARLGGDEFGVLLEDCSLEQAMTIAEGARAAIHEHRFAWGARTLSVGASIGLVEISRETDSVAAVMSAVDIACYAAKDEGRNRVRVYDSGSSSGRHREMYWVARVTQAVEENRLAVFFQPIVAIGESADQTAFHEFTVRLLDQDGRLVPPSEFIPAAERYNVMATIDRWVVERATELLAGIAAAGRPMPLVAVNLSGTSLNDQGFLEFVLARIAEPQIARALCFEITETAAVANLSSAVYFMRELKSRGCRFSLDDFGSGVSSFMYLKNLPIDFLKIDGQFIANIAHDPVDRSMVEAITRVGRTLGIRTIADRVATQAVLNELARIGVDFAQGFLLAKPRSIAEFPGS